MEAFQRENTGKHRVSRDWLSNKEFLKSRKYFYLIANRAILYLYDVPCRKASYIRGKRKKYAILLTLHDNQSRFTVTFKSDD